MTFSKVTLSISDTQHNNALPCAECRYTECHILFAILLSVYAECRYAECCYAECRGAIFSVIYSCDLLSINLWPVL